jgi:tetratricopeptide (TPR) repeat protein
VIEAQRVDPAEAARVFGALTAAMRGAVADRSLDEAAGALGGSTAVPQFDRVEATLHEHRELAARWVAALEDALGAVEEAARRARLRRFDPEAWPMRRDALATAFEREPDGAVSEWIAAYADALAHWELEFCERLAEEPFALPPRAAHLHDLLRTATAAIREERFGDAEPLLEYLVDPRDGYVLPLADNTRALLLAMLGRIEIYDVEQPDEALRHLLEAATLAPEDARVRAALGDLHRSRGEADAARGRYQAAIAASPPSPQGYVGMGLLAEDRGWSDEADDWYEQAMPPLTDVDTVQRFRRSLRALRAPASGNVYLELARSVRKVDPEVALDALDRALELGMNQAGTWPDRVAHKLRGSVLADLGRDTEAAAAYFDAGWRFYSEAELVVAAECFERADELSPGNVETLRYWADTLLVLSQLDEPPYVERGFLDRALELWDAASRAGGALDSASSWTLVSRARMVDRLSLVQPEDRWQLEWEAVAFTERAIVHNDDDAFRWSMLGQFLRSVGLEANGLVAAARAIEIAPDNASALEEYAAINANLGNLVEAERAIDARRALEGSNAWHDVVKAFTLVYRGEAAEALPLLDGAVAAVPTELWYRDLRGVCHDLLGNRDEAEADNRFIWEQRSGANEGDLSRIASAGSFLGEYEEALKILEGLAVDPSQEATVRRALALDRLAAGDLARAEAELAALVEASTSAFELRTLELDFGSVLRRTRDRPDGPAIASLVEAWMPRILSRADEVDGPRSPVGELEKVIAREREARGWPWVGAQAALARVHAAEGRAEEAAAAYSALLEERERFPEAAAALAAVATIGSNAGAR